MKLLILTQYFTPDLSAGSFRMQALVDALESYAIGGLEVDLITTLPNRYNSLTLDAPIEEDRGWLRIHRLNLPEHKSGMIDQSFAYLSYMQGVLKKVRGGSWDLVFATSSRLMTAVLGAYVAKRNKIPYYLDIRDLFTDNLQDLFSRRPVKISIFIFRLLENMVFRNALRINIVSPGFLPYIKKISPQVDVKIFTNGIDDIFNSEKNWSTSEPTTLPLILYAGNIGEGQGLHRIIPKVGNLLKGRAKLRIIGDGGRRDKLEKALKRLGVENVEILPPMSRSKLIKHYQEAAILFIHLNDFNSFKKVLPSKIFEYGTTGKPILAGVSGYAEKFIKEEFQNAIVFPPLDVTEMVLAVEKLLKFRGNANREKFRHTYSRRTIMKKMAKDILNTIEN